MIPSETMDGGFTLYGLQFLLLYSMLGMGHANSA